MRTAAHRAGVVASVLLSGALVLVALGGCVPEPSPTTSPVASTPSSTPLFASDDEALAAATDAYKAYLAMSDLILSEGGVNPERIESLVTGDALDVARADFEEFRTKNVHLVGHTSFSVNALQSVDVVEDHQVATMYVCNDVSGVDILDAGGASLIQPARDPITPFVVEVELFAKANILSSKVLWTGRSFC